MSRTVLLTVLVLGLLLPAAASAELRATLTDRGELLVDGKPFLPIFVWAQPSKLIPFHRDLGINCLHPGEKVELDPTRAYLDQLHEAGMMGLVHAERATAELIEHPAALAWMVEHEPDMAQKPGYRPDLAGEATVVWIEGEAAQENTLERSPWLDKPRAQLSGGRWLTTQKGEGQARWRFTVPEAGTYQLWVREFTKNWANPTRWTLDDREPQVTPRSTAAHDVVNFGGGQGVGWAHYGEVELAAGEHTLTFEVVPGRTTGKADREPAEEPILAVDAICFTTAERYPPAAPAEPTPRRDPDVERQAFERIKALNPDALTWNVLTGGFFEPYRKLPLRYYEQFLRWTDMASFDHYPITGWNKPQRLPEVGLATAKLVALSRANQPVWTVVEASDQDLSWTPKETRGPTAAEMRAEVWSAIAHGARGIGYFTIAFNPFRWNHLTDEIRAEMKRTNGELTELAGPIVMGHTTRKLTVTGDDTDAPHTDGRAIHAIRKDHDGKVYVVAVNVTREAVAPTFALEGVGAGRAEVWKENRSVGVSNGSFRDTFEPLAVHIYLLSE
jgi:hypothetical protein